MSDGTSTTDTSCEPAPGLGLLELGDWDQPEALVATDEGLWVAGGGISGAFVSAISFDGKAEVLFTMANARASALTLVGGDTLVVAGRIGGDPNDPAQPGIFLRGLSLDGDELWAVRFGSWPSSYVAALAPGPDESVYIAGTTDHAPADPNGGPFLLKYDAAGNLERSIDLDANGYLSVEDMTATEEGALYAAVRVDYTASPVVRALGDDGEVLWELSSSLLGCSFCNELFAGDDGDLYVAGTSDGDVSLARVSPGGEVLWTSIVPHGPSDEVGVLTVTGDGAYLFARSFEGTDSESHLLAVHFGPDGEQRDIEATEGPRTEMVSAAASTPAGDVFLAGVSMPGFNSRGRTRAFVMDWPEAP